MPARSERFGRLLKAGISSIANVEGKTAPVIEEELGGQIGVAAHTIQRYKAGHLPPEPRSIQILAEACVRRGHLNREWLQAFLQSAHYPAAEQLLGQLYPSEAAEDPPGARLPQPAGPHLQPVCDAPASLRRRARRPAPALGGCADGQPGRHGQDQPGPRGGRALPQRRGRYARGRRRRSWLSDKDRPGTTNLSVVLNEIARTLDYPGLTQLAYDEKRHEVEQLLRRQVVLVIIDNFETITDDALLHWLLRLPEPSKAIITTREYRRELRSSWPIDLGGMDQAEARQLIAERLRALKIERLVGGSRAARPADPRHRREPKAIELAIGLIKYERRPLPQVIDDLRTARAARCSRICFSAPGRCSMGRRGMPCWR